MLQLILLRHAKTDRNSDSGSDIDRKLLPRGINQGKELSSYFENNRLMIDQVFVSNATRTKQTYSLIESSLGKHSVHFSDELYLCNPSVLLDLISNNGTSDTILVVGHNFGISEFASYLSDQPIHLATSELVRLELDIQNWKELSGHQAKISEVFRPQAQ